MTSPRAYNILDALLRDGEDMPRKYQNPKLEIRRDVDRPYYFIRVSVPVLTADGPAAQRQRKRLGFTDEMTKKDALKERARVLEVVNAGRMLASSQVKFLEVVQRFLDIRVPQLGVSRQAKYRTQFRLHILPALGEMKMHEIDRPAVESFLHAKKEQGLNWWSLVDLKGILSAVFTTAADWKLWTGDNPTKGVRMGKKKAVYERRLLTADQMRAILAAVDDRCRFLVLILFGTGLAVSEALGLQWRDVDFEAGTVAVRRRWYRGDLAEETKTENRTRVVQLGPLVEEFRNRYQPGSGERFVFTDDAGSLPPDDRDLLRFSFRPVLVRLGLYYRGFGWHAFRRANVTWRQQVGGATPLEAQRAAGHGSLNMTYLYTLADAGRESQQVQAMFEKLMGEGGVN